MTVLCIEMQEQLLSWPHSGTLQMKKEIARLQSLLKEAHDDRYRPDHLFKLSYSLCYLFLKTGAHERKPWIL